MGRLFIVTGFPGAGKTTIAARLAQTIGGIVVAVDEHAYEPAGSWSKAPAALLLTRVMAAIDAAGDAGVVVESTYLDVHDPERGRQGLLRALLPRADGVVVLRESLDHVGAAVIQRSLDRASGRCAPGVAPETGASVWAMAAKLVKSYDVVSEALQQFALSVPPTRLLQMQPAGSPAGPHHGMDADDTSIAAFLASVSSPV